MRLMLAAAAIMLVSFQGTSGQAPLTLAGTIPLPGVEGRIDHFDHYRLLTNATRLSLVYEYDKLLSISNSKMVPEAYQLLAVKKVMESLRQRFLIADDVADTGKTLELVRNFVVEHVAEARCAVVYEKPGSLVKCEYVWKRTDDWINFPWSVEPPVVRRENQVLDA